MKSISAQSASGESWLALHTESAGWLAALAWRQPGIAKQLSGWRLGVNRLAKAGIGGVNNVCGSSISIWRNKLSGGSQLKAKYHISMALATRRK
jgi:hypothetical protein